MYGICTYVCTYGISIKDKITRRFIGKGRKGEGKILRDIEMRNPCPSPGVGGGARARSIYYARRVGVPLA